MLNHHTPDPQKILERLTLPSSRVRMVLDTDTYNEIDDQFALTYALLQPDRLALEAVYAAPFLNTRSVSPADGMQKSLSEIHRILELVPCTDPPETFAGSKSFLSTTPDSTGFNDASTDLIARSKQGVDPLYVVAIGAPTNIANALMRDPTLAERVVIVWLGGHPLNNCDTREFNLYQDIAASRALFDSGAPLIVVPCKQVAELLATTVPELRAHIDESSGIGRYLLQIASEYIKSTPGASRPIWDVAALALLVNPDWFETAIISSPGISDTFHWIPSSDRHPIRVVTHLKRDEIMHSLFTTLARASIREVRQNLPVARKWGLG